MGEPQALNNSAVFGRAGGICSGRDAVYNVHDDFSGEDIIMHEESGLPVDLRTLIHELQLLASGDEESYDRIAINFQ